MQQLDTNEEGDIKGSTNNKLSGIVFLTCVLVSVCLSMLGLQTSNRFPEIIKSVARYKLRSLHSLMGAGTDVEYRPAFSDSYRHDVMPFRTLS